uniref:Uncharacterized protein n=1 Tax=Plectus sambesii TaxID=2011161 RepID=A0A914UIP0_9BILA
MTKPPLNGRLKPRSERGGGGGGRRTGGNGGRGGGRCRRPSEGHSSAEKGNRSASRHASQQRAFEPRRGDAGALGGRRRLPVLNRVREGRARTPEDDDDDDCGGGCCRAGKNERTRLRSYYNAFFDSSSPSPPKKASTSGRTRADYYDGCAQWVMATAGGDTCDPAGRTFDAI